ncbi:MAG: holin family protein [Pelagimonas sp.]|uniref:holin family protein n=1 Tax=Pelagimonas sp. TaxID=2073170 RepID=UPI003D6BC7B2
MRILQWLFGGGRNVIADTVEVFRPNAEAGAQRHADYQQAALAQFGTEFQSERKGRFDRFMDGLNRLPRPLIVIATFAMFATAMFDPIWFAERMQGLALVPDPLWLLAGTIVAFYFGGRFQVKSQEFQQSIARTASMVPAVVENITRLRALRHDTPGTADVGTDVELAEIAIVPTDNAAVMSWRQEVGA